MNFETNTIEKAYEATGRTPFEMPAIPGLPEADRQYMKDQFDWTVCVEAINKEANGGVTWIPNYQDGTTKYELVTWPVPSDTDPSGWVFSDASYGCTGTGTDSGSRLNFYNEEAMWHCINTFPDLYKKVFLKK